MITSITIPATVDTINSSCFYGCTVLEQVSLAEGNTAFTVTDGVLFSANGEDLIVYPQAMEGTSYTIRFPKCQCSMQSFKFRSVMSEEVSDTENTAVAVEETESGWQKYGKWILLGAGALYCS